MTDKLILCSITGLYNFVQIHIYDKKQLIVIILIQNFNYNDIAERLNLLLLIFNFL
ncbi:hypothetical protein MNBD_IGNAVI01-2482 [hydrothermal vent metagenome]|uniref:Uncharacterized protein n=1 Tax=hydrothermal vent metagenome TaxID=652676 RepID=A0A3B1CV84_9ZZZZ